MTDSSGNRRTQEARFKQDRDVHFPVATDAAGEGINLQRAHLMINYDLPWNPNRLEQWFGRIHRIGQTEVCHLWNLVASETREGSVFERLLSKLEVMEFPRSGRRYQAFRNLPPSLRREELQNRQVTRRQLLRFPVSAARRYRYRRWRARSRERPSRMLRRSRNLRYGRKIVSIDRCNLD